MGIINLKSNETIHKRGEKVETIEIIVKGKVSVSVDDSFIVLDVGGIIGCIEHPGQTYEYTYKSLEDSAIYSYPYNSIDDLEKIVISNPKISSILATQSIRIIVNALEQIEKDYNSIKAEYDQVLADHEEYPMLAVSVGNEVETFPEIEDLKPPQKLRALTKWQEKFYRGLLANEDSQKKHVYISPDISNGIVLYCAEALAYISACRGQIWEYKDYFKKNTSNFKSIFQLAKAKSNDMKRDGSDGSMTDIDIKNALDIILQYAGADDEATENFRNVINEFKKTPNRYDSSDENRVLRRKVANDYYTIYTSAFLRSLHDPMIPSEVMMFLMFGFVDEELAGLENTRQLYVLMKTYKPDPDGFVLTAYEWLKKVYSLEREPSRNEFDEDYFTALRTLKTSGDIDETQMEIMKNDPAERLKFEVKNLLALGNRMSFGRPSTFVPVFDAENVIRPLDKSYIDYKKIHDFYDYIRSIDYSVFCRQGIYSNPDIGVNQVFISEDVTPFMILMPNIGSRASVWQEIEGKKRNTPARMIISIFHTETLEDVMIRVCGEFRWEMCKTEQGVHWNDVTDPSLTSMYCDYLQFYKKNHTLSSDMKEKLKTQLQKYNNNYKNVFVSDYINYIKFEANSSPRLNKVAREIIFTFCPFNKEMRDKMIDNPQYNELIKKHVARMAGLSRPLTNMIKRLRAEQIDIPQDMMDQFDFLKK